MKKPLEIYALAVCFCALICFAIYLGSFVYQMARMTFPEITSPNYKEQGFEEIVKTLSPVEQQAINSIQAASRIDISEAKKMYWNLNKKVSMEAERRDAIQNAIKYFIVLIVDIAIFIPHWRLARKQDVMK